MLSTVIWAVARLGWAPDEAWLGAYLEAVQAHMQVRGGGGKEGARAGAGGATGCQGQ